MLLVIPKICITGTVVIVMLATFLLYLCKPYFFLITFLPLFSEELNVAANSVDRLPSHFSHNDGSTVQYCHVGTLLALYLVRILHLLWT